VTSPAPANFDAQDITIAFACALLAQLLFVLTFSLPSPKLVQADISNDNAQPIAVAITPVLKLGTKTPSKMAAQWQRKKPVQAKSQAPVPSPQAEKTPQAIPTQHVPDASTPLSTLDAGKTTEPDLAAPAEGGVATVSSSEGSEQGAANGTEVDSLKGRAVDMYRAQLASWLMAHFSIRGKIPFEKLKTLRSTISVTVTADRKVGSVSILKASGDPTFDAEVQATFARIQSAGAELPAPPSNYPDLLDKPFRVTFECTDRGRCE
jgi:outer membrane biosynthesis protein TonB